MSHCPGLALEDWITDWYRLVDSDGEHGTGIRRMYTGQLILNREQFKRLVEIHEPIRGHVEERLLDYSEEECGSWRDYCDCFSVPKEMAAQAEEYLKSLRGNVPETPGLTG